MRERTEYDTIYVSNEGLFRGTLDNGGTISVGGPIQSLAIGRENISNTLRSEFVDRRGVKREYADILVKEEDLEDICTALEASNVTLPEKTTKPLDKIRGKLPPKTRFDQINCKDPETGEVETLVVYDARHWDQYPEPEDFDLFAED